jgi:hypothetical protein
MCFSASASFITASLTGAIGLVSLTRVNLPRQVPLAAVPLFFAAQQGIEGLLWLSLPSASGGTIATDLTFAFLLFAQVFWPVHAPFTVWLIEPGDGRRRLMLLCLAIGVGVSAYLLRWLLTWSHHATILDNHIVYVTEGRYSDSLGLGYLVATSVPLMLSSRRTLLALGAIVLLSSVVAHLFYWEAFVSVWCFFAAAASLVILCHFEQSRRRRLRTAAA